MQRRDRATGAGKLSASGAAEAGEGGGHVDRADLPADAGGRASLSQEPGRGLLPGIEPGTAELRTERAADAHQQGRRSVSANPAGAGSAPHSGAVWSRQRSAPLGFEAGRARRQEREETSHYCSGAKAGRLAASPVGERRGLRTIAQEQANSDAGGCINPKTVCERKSQSLKPSSGDCVKRLA